MNVAEAALWAIIAICLVLLGALITPGVVTTEQKAPVLAGIITVLFAIGWRMRKKDGE